MWIFLFSWKFEMVDSEALKKCEIPVSAFGEQFLSLFQMDSNLLNSTEGRAWKN